MCFCGSFRMIKTCASATPFFGSQGRRVDTDTDPCHESSQASTTRWEETWQRGATCLFQDISQ